MKKLLIFLILCLLPICGNAAIYDEYAFTPQQGAASVSYVALKDSDYVYNNLRDLTLMGIFRQERSFSLANYVTNLDALKMLFRCAGLEQYAYDCGEDTLRRQSLAVPPTRPYSVSDGFFIAAYEKGLISSRTLEGYFSDRPGCRANDYVVRGDVIVWLAKLFGIQPSYNFTTLEKYGNTSLISAGSKPYFAGVLNSGIGLIVNGSYQACSLIKNSDLVTLLARFYPYLLQANGIESVSGTVSSVDIDPENGNMTLSVSGGDTIFCTPDKTGLLTGKNYIDNLYMLSHPSAVGKKITYFTKNGEFLFASTNINRPEEEVTETLSGTLFFYDDLTGCIVLKDGDKGYTEYFLAEKAEILIDGIVSPPELLMEHTDREFQLELTSCNEYSFKRITRIKSL